MKQGENPARGLAQDKRRYQMTARRDAMNETRERILEATYRLWLERHYDELTLAAVAQAAGVTRQTVYRQFGTKEELLVAVGQWRAPQEDRAREVEPGDVTTAVQRVIERNEEMGDANVRALELEGRIDIIGEMLARGRRAHRAWIERVFGPSLDRVADSERDQTIMALYAATDVTVWKVLRRDFGFSRSDTEAIVSRLVQGVLSDSARKERI